jgi:hypothetical protein
MIQRASKALELGKKLRRSVRKCKSLAELEIVFQLVATEAKDVGLTDAALAPIFAHASEEFKGRSLA